MAENSEIAVGFVVRGRTIVKSGLSFSSKCTKNGIEVAEFSRGGLPPIADWEKASIPIRPHGSFAEKSSSVGETEGDGNSFYELAGQVHRDSLKGHFFASKEGDPEARGEWVSCESPIGGTAHFRARRVSGSPVKSEAPWWQGGTK